MQARLTTKPVDEVIAAIHAIDLESVKRRAMDPELGEGWSREYADSVEAAYRNFLTMLVKYPAEAEDILLSEDVDEFWHTHILQTRKYADDCQRAFGSFLHHNPDLGERTPAMEERRAALMTKTRSLYEREFGNAELAWAGHGRKTDRSAYCDATVKAAAYCDASVQVRKTAYCDATAKAAAYCDASVQARKTAYCDATVAEVSHGARPC